MLNGMFYFQSSVFLRLHLRSDRLLVRVVTYWVSLATYDAASPGR